MAGVKSAKAGASIVRFRYLDEKQVKPVKYVGEHGRYLAGSVGSDFELVVDAQGKPIPFSKIGALGDIINKSQFKK
jgi:hypothetical protein